MNQDEYIQQRVDDQISWMEGKSKHNQNMYKLFKILEIVFAAAIPMLVTFNYHKEYFSIAAGILGVLIVIINGIQQLNKYNENWLTYRATIESLKREKFLFEAQSDPYNDSAAFYRFVQNCEAILVNESKKWGDTWRSKQEQKDDKKVP